MLSETDFNTHPNTHTVFPLLVVSFFKDFFTRSLSASEQIGFGSEQTPTKAAVRGIRCRYKGVI